MFITPGGGLLIISTLETPFFPLSYFPSPLYLNLYLLTLQCKVENIVSFIFNIGTVTDLRLSALFYR